MSKRRVEDTEFNNGPSKRTATSNLLDGGLNEAVHLLPGSGDTTYDDQRELHQENNAESTAADERVIEDSHRSIVYVAIKEVEDKLWERHEEHVLGTFKTALKANESIMQAFLHDYNPDAEDIAAPRQVYGADGTLRCSCEIPKEDWILTRKHGPTRYNFRVERHYLDDHLAPDRELNVLKQFEEAFEKAKQRTWK